MTAEGPENKEIFDGAPDISEIADGQRKKNLVLVEFPVMTVLKRAKFFFLSFDWVFI